jgi:hypothetical protein
MAASVLGMGADDVVLDDDEPALLPPLLPQAAVPRATVVMASAVRTVRGFM